MNRGLYILKCVVLGLIFVILIGLITMYLWNWLVPMLFKGPEITYIQTLGLLILSKILFSGLGGKGHYSHHHDADESHSWKQKFSKYSNMTPEERDALKQKMKEKWCSWEKNSPAKNQDDSNV